ncbi:SulP family inorganic anion transporter [Streptomyces sp. NPDC088789]|uniref:SulP family inorganic anion transporter n=1 Tax=Streptomyces sp. NPDC088789 TaxID=3365899 RepID=UPI0037FE9666
MSAFRTLPQALETARATGTRLVDARRRRPAHPPHNPPPVRRGGFHLAGADVSASLAVFLIALPLSLGIALATDAPLQAGLVAAAVGGLVAGRLGGSALQVSGPAAGLTVVTADLIHRYGWRTTCAITVLAGLAQLGLGCLRVARSALAVSPAIVHGMLAGIGITIAVAQLHIVLGGNPQSAVLDNLRALPDQLAQLHPAAVSMSALTLSLLLLWPRIPGRAGELLRTVPAPLVAVTGATATASLAGLTLPKVALPSWQSHALAGLPEGPALGIAAAVLTTTLVCSVQSLLGAVAVDKLAASRPGLTAKVGRSDLDRELLGQGAANIASGALGGLPVAGVAVRSSANVNAGAVSRNSTMLHGVLVVVAALLMVPLLELIPLASLAALVMAVGIQMVSLNHIRTVTRHREVLVYAVTTLGVVLLGVLEGVSLGIAVAVAVALHRLARTRITHDEQEGAHHVHVRGQLTFLAVPRLSRALHQVPHGSHAVVELDGSFMDHAAYETLQDWRNTHTAQGGTVELTGRRGAVRITEPTVSHLLDLDRPPGTPDTPDTPGFLDTLGPANGSYWVNSANWTAGTHTDRTDKADNACPGGTAGTTGTAGAPLADCRCRPWTPWRNHQCEPPETPRPSEAPAPPPEPGQDPPGPGREGSTPGREGTTTPAPDAGPGTGTERGPGTGPGAGPGTGTGTGRGPETGPEQDGSATTPSTGTPPPITSTTTSTTTPGRTPPTTPGRAAPTTPVTPRLATPTPTTTPTPAPAPSPSPSADGASGRQLARGISAFQRNTAPLVRGELARLAREGQRPVQLFLTCTDSRLVTSMITSSGPGDLFVVRNLGNLVPLPGAENGDDSVAAAIEYAVDVLKVRSITVCGHSGCGAMQALFHAEPGGARSPLGRWLRHGRPSMERMADENRPSPRLAGRPPADALEQLSLTNVVQQLEHLRAHEAVGQALRSGRLELHGMYFHVGEAQAYLLTEQGDDRVFDDVAGAGGLPVG